MTCRTGDERVAQFPSRGSGQNAVPDPKSQRRCDKRIKKIVRSCDRS